MQRELLAQGFYFGANRINRALIALGFDYAIDPCRDGEHLGFFEASRRRRRGAQAQTRSNHRRAWIVRDPVLVGDQPRRLKPLLGFFAGEFWVFFQQAKQASDDCPSHPK